MSTPLGLKISGRFNSVRESGCGFRDRAIQSRISSLLLSVPEKIDPARFKRYNSRMKLVRKTEVWRPTRWGVLLIFLLLAVVGMGLSLSLYPFLAQNHPLPQAELIIIEGWMPDAELLGLIDSLEPGTLFVTTGGPIKLGGNLFKEKTYAAMTTSRLRNLGVLAESIVSAPAPDVGSDRTYASAQAVRDKLKEQGLFGRPANIYTLGAHGRRSFFLYKKAFGPSEPLGVVSLENEELDLRHWCSSSLAFRQVVSEAIAWLYVQCTRWKY